MAREIMHIMLKMTRITMKYHFINLAKRVQHNFITTY